MSRICPETCSEVSFRAWDCLVRLTSIPEALWKDADLGTITPGKLADVIVVEGDALADLSAVRNVVTVLRDGVPFEAAALLDEAREVAAAASG